MNNVIELLNHDSFSTTTLGAAVKLSGKVWGKIKKMGIFRFQPIKTTSVVIDIENDGLVVLPQTKRGGPATAEKKTSEKAVYFNVPNFKRKEILTAADLQDVRDCGETSLRTLQNTVMKSIAKLDRKIEVTLEYLMAGALTGKLYDGDGNLIVDLFQKLGVSQSTAQLDLAGDDKTILGQLSNISDIIEGNIGEDVSDGNLIICGKNFWSALLSNPILLDAYKHQGGVKNPLINDVRDGFEWQGFTFVKYAATVKNARKQEKKFIPDDEAVALPLGTQDTFIWFGAPADLISKANEDGEEKTFTVSPSNEQGEEQVVVRGETNPLPICTNPKVLVKLTQKPVTKS